MESKARENLEAARLLRQEALLDSAASRAYYSAYLSVWAWLENQGVDPPDHDGRKYWRHDTVADGLLTYSGTDLDDFEAVLTTGPEVQRRCLAFERLRSSRVKADYFKDHVTEAEVTSGVKFAEELMHDLLGG